MAVQSDTSRIQYAGNNSTTTSYAVPFVFQENSHLKAIARTAAGVESVVTLTNHAGAGNVNGGTVRTAVAVPATSTLTIYREVPITQTTSYAEGGDFPAASHEDALDKLTYITQQLDRRVDTCIRGSEAAPIAPLPSPVGTQQFVLATTANQTPSWQPQSAIAIGPVIATGSSEPRFVSDRFGDVVNVKDFGAVGDGVADDTAAIQAALDAAAASGNQVYGPAGNYRVTGTLNVECSGDLSAMTIRANATTLSPVVRLGKAAGFSAGKLMISLPKIFNTARVAGDGWIGYENSIGLTVDNLVDSIVTLSEINGFGIGASIGGTDTGNQTNQYFIPFIYRCRVGMLVERKSPSGWSNENTYYIGRIRKDSNESKVISGCTGSAATDEITKTAHGLTNGTIVGFTTLTGGSGLTINTVNYFVVNATANTFQVSLTSGGAAEDILTDYSSITIQLPYPNTRVIKVGIANNNVFIRPCVETSMMVDERALEIEDGSYNMWLSPRWEISRAGAARPPVLLKGTAGSSCTGNCFLGGMNFVTPSLIIFEEQEAVSGAVYANTVIGDGRQTQSLNGLINLTNQGGDGVSVPHLQGIAAGQSPLDRGSSFAGWVYRLHSSGINGKRTGDSFPRLRLDWLANNGTGRVFFGSSSVDPTTYITGEETNFDMFGYANVRGRRPDGSVAWQIQRAETTLTALSGATVTATNFIPAGSIVLGVTARVTTAITGATSFDIGDGTDVDRWGAARNIALNTTTTGSSFTITSLPIYASATSVVLTANGSDFTGGDVKLSVSYISLGAPAA